MAATTNASTAASQAQAMAAANAQARDYVLRNAIKATQIVWQQSGLSPSSQQTLNIAPRNVGLIRGFYVRVQVQGTTPTGVTLTRTTLGPSNVLANVQFSDLSNQQRINCAGWYLAHIDTARRRSVANAAITTDTTLGYGSNFPVMLCPSTVPPATAWTVDMWHYVPLSYTDRDLRGSIFAAVVSATMNLQLNLNYNGFFASSTQDPTLSVFSFTGSGPTISSWGVTVYQDYLDQLPFSGQGPILPLQDMSWSYLLNTTSMSAMTQGQDFPIPFPNFRNIQSLHVIYDNGGALLPGTDINYLALQSANYTNVFKVEPAMQAILTRNLIGDDCPRGMYYFDFRDKPLSTIQYGNLNLVINPSSVGAGGLAAPQFLIGFEQLAQQSQIVGAGSIPGG